MNASLIHTVFSWKSLLSLFVVALLVRLAVFGLYVQDHERYHQADSMDYHNCALGIGLGLGMARADTLEPIFWRTPGYPWYLSFFYRLYGISSALFADNAPAQKAALYVQIIFCSLVPWLIFLLALLLTQIPWVALSAAWISVFHVGFVLATTYLLTDGLAQLFFIGFMFFLYRSFVFVGEPNKHPLSVKKMMISAALSAILLALYTWIRPHGEFVACLAMVLLLLGACAWRLRFCKTVMFGMIFFLAIGAWYYRNYQLTGHWFFCPMSGPYLQCFSAPKIMRRLTGQPLDKCLYSLLYKSHQTMMQERERLAKTNPLLVFPRELSCGQVARPYIWEHPGYFLYDWVQEVTKTTFDLYSSQLVAFANNSYTYDPIEEFLPEKVQQCLYAQPMHWFMRLIAWLEFVFYIVLWIGLLAGLWYFVIISAIKKLAVAGYEKKMFFLWIKTGILIGGMLMMTGGFGYARLRIPFEPLMIILSLTWWYWILYGKDIQDIKAKKSSLKR